jgi:hypothetical protein
LYFHASIDVPLPVYKTVMDNVKGRMFFMGDADNVAYTLMTSSTKVLVSACGRTNKVNRVVQGPVIFVQVSS